LSLDQHTILITLKTAKNVELAGIIMEINDLRGFNRPQPLVFRLLHPSFPLQNFKELAPERLTFFSIPLRGGNANGEFAV
jgi:hypothetical protein